MWQKRVRTVINCRCCVVCLALLLICLGVTALLWFHTLYKNILTKKLTMTPGNDAYDNWLNPPNGVYMKYYFFNYTNVEEIKAGAKPLVKQIGPYTYKGIVKNTVVASDQFHITYKEKLTYYFHDGMSCVNCSKDDVIVTPSSTAATLLDSLYKLHIGKNSSYFQRFALKALNIIFKTHNVHLFQPLTVDEILWGYNDTFLEYLQQEEEKYGWILKALGWNLPPIPTTFIALQYNASKLSSFVGNQTLLTGQQNINTVQKIIRWRGLRQVDFWNDEYGNMINGTDASRFHPFIKKSDKLYMFLTYYCRSLYITYDAEQTIKGIKLYGFHLTEEILANSSINPSNKAFCDERCWPSGLIHIAKCLPGHPPVFLSLPHFYLGDQHLIDAIDGIHPEKDLHETIIAVEPVTGLSMNSHQRLQLNFFVQPVPFLDMVSGLHEEIFLPVLYLDSASVIDDKNAKLIRDEVLLPMKIVYYSKYVLMGIGSIILILTLTSCVIKRNKKVGKFSKL
ncbi:lysosome membrane protein 2-like [Hydractinia symbiolongicarpus]|uniref:lysosome membrane protein 2-like n=1 Tax=Hydractinia symbiolongicarpus TaxID=13093 RepID=UPI00254F542B|nr:lysosome membrane protein 2-like [Hydractinia symbiolongicarpus]